MAVGLVADLGLNKSPSAHDVAPYSLLNEATLILKGVRLKKEHTLEDMRSCLGCYFLVST